MEDRIAFSRCAHCREFTDFVEPLREGNKHTFTILCKNGCGELICSWQEDFDEELEIEEKFNGRGKTWSDES